MAPDEPLRRSRELADQRRAGVRAAFLDAGCDATVLGLGGVARRDLCPAADVDLLVLTDRADENIEHALRTLWDGGWQVASRVLAPRDVKRAAKDDDHLATALLEAVAVSGPRAGEDLATVQRALFSPGFRKKLARSKVRELLERRERYANQTEHFEPYLKRLPGGLRDVHAVLWVGLCLSFWRGRQDPHERSAWAHLVDVGRLFERERARLLGPYQKLVGYRAALHELAGRAEERVRFELQAELAQQLGVLRADLRAPEALLTEIVNTAREIESASNDILSRWAEAENDKALLVPPPHPKVTGDVPAPWFVKDGALHRQVSTPAQLADAISAYRVAGETGARLATRTKNWLRGALEDPAAAEDQRPTALRAVLRLCQSQDVRHPVFAPLLVDGFLPAVFEDIARLSGRFRQDGAHAYATDMHIARVCDAALQVASGTFEVPPALTPAYARLPDTGLVVLGALFHDLGKGTGRDHSLEGKDIASRELWRMGATKGDIATVQFLVEHHLILSRTSQRRDLADVNVIRGVAEVVKSIERLDLLTLLTFVDISQVAPGMFTEWKGHLLGALNRAVADYLRESPDAAPLSAALAEDARQRARETLAEAGVGAAPAIDRFVEGATITGLEARWGGALVEDFHAHVAFMDSGGQPLVKVVAAPGTNNHIVRVVTGKTGPGLTALAAALAREGANVVFAFVDRRTDGCTLYSFRVDSGAGQPLSEAQAERLERTLDEVLAGDGTVSLPAFLAPKKGAPIPGRVRITEEIDSWGALVVDITARDRPGLFAVVLKTMDECGYRVRLAKATTLGSRVQDSFIVDKTGEGEADPARLAQALGPVVNGAW